MGAKQCFALTRTDYWANIWRVNIVFNPQVPSAAVCSKVVVLLLFTVNSENFARVLLCEVS